MTGDLSIALVFGAGLASVLSPCVLPVVPIIVTGSSSDHRLRPLMIVSGLALTFTAMGVVSSLFGTLIGSKMVYLTKAAGAVITLFGLLLLFNVNLFKHLGFLSRLADSSRGKASAFILGLMLGIIWIPCVGPMLSSVLFMVAAKKEIAAGVFYLLLYSLGFAVPMLIAGYAMQFFRTRVRKIGKFPLVINIASGLILVAFGAVVFFRGSLGLGF
jgi:cytochrome c-type biogenesis protein